MRRLVGRHSGELPITTVEHIWREIITTFTRMQAPFDVATDGSADPDRMRDLARFYFGFSVNLLRLRDARAVVAHVAATGDLGIVARDQDTTVGAWWRVLGKPSGPQIMAVLPYIEAPGRPADLPAFVIGHSEGAMIAEAVAADAPDLAGVVLLAGAGVSGEDSMKWQATQIAQVLPPFARAVTGLLRMGEPGSGFLRNNDPAANLWYSRDLPAIATARGLADVAPYFIDADAASSPGKDPAREPVGGLTVINFPNNHLTYAITWYALALMVIVGVAIFVREEKRARRPA